MGKFQVGDRVVCTEAISVLTKGMKGTVKGYHNNGAVGVEWDALTSGHNGNGDGMVCAEGKGWYLEEYMIELLQRPSIHITTDGRTTRARAEAICSPHDEFDFETGARIAFDRLYRSLAENSKFKGEQKPAPEPITLYCVKDYKPGKGFAKGKIYTAKSNGTQLTFDDGAIYHRNIFRAKTLNAIKIVPNYLVPEVKRPAKVGEWVLVKDRGSSAYKSGEIYQVFDTGPGNCVWFANDCKGNIKIDNYVVLEGYQPEPEKPKKRIFSTVKFIETEGAAEYMRHKDWVDLCEGEEVVDGGCNSIMIKNKWTVEGK